MSLEPLLSHQSQLSLQVPDNSGQSLCCDSPAPLLRPLHIQHCDLWMLQVGSQALGLQWDDWSGSSSSQVTDSGGRAAAPALLCPSVCAVTKSQSPQRLRSDTRVESFLKAPCVLNQDTTGKTLEEGQ